MSGIVGDFIGYKIIVTESCCDYVQKRKYKKKPNIIVGVIKQRMMTLLLKSLNYKNIF